MVPAVPEGAPLTPELFREALEALDPEAVVLLDEPAAALMREAYADALSQIEQFEVAMLEPGLVAHVLGRRVLALGGLRRRLPIRRPNSAFGPISSSCRPSAHHISMRLR